MKNFDLAAADARGPVAARASAQRFATNTSTLRGFDIIAP